MRGTSLAARGSTAVAAAVEPLAGTAGGLLISEDAGETWATLASSLRKGSITAVATHPLDPRIIYAYGIERGVGLVRSQDGGRTWTSQGFFPGERDAVEALGIDAEGG